MTPASAALRIAIRGYQLLLSPVLPASCRYHPTCSSYALDAVRVHGAARGGWLALRRLGRCHPWGGEGYDPVPPANRADGHHEHHDGSGACCSGKA